MGLHKSLLLGTAFAAAMLGACGSDDAVPETNGVQEIALQSPPVLSLKKMKADAEVPINSGLTPNLNLEEFITFVSDEYGAYGTISGSNGNFVITDFAPDDSAFIKRIAVTGFHLTDDETPYFDTLVVEGFRGGYGGGPETVSIDKAYLNPPSYEDFLKVSETMAAGLYDDTLGTGGTRNPFIATGGGYIEGMSVDIYGNSMTADFFGWSEDSKNKAASVMMRNVSLIGSEADLDFNVKMDLFAVENMDLQYIESNFTENPFYYNMFKPYYERVAIENARFSADEMFLDIKQSNAWVTEPENGVSMAYISPDPIRFGFMGEPSTEEMQTFKNVYDKLGYDIMEFSFEGSAKIDHNNDLTSTENSKLILKDGFEMGFNYQVQGTEQSFPNLKTVFDKYIDLDVPSEAELEEAFAQLVVDHMSMSFTDNSIIDRSVKVAADMQGMDEALIRQQMASAMMMVTLAAQTPYQGELASEFAESMSNLVKDGGTVRMSLRQDESLSWAKFLKAFEADVTPDLDPFLKGLGLKTEYIAADN